MTKIGEKEIKDTTEGNTSVTEISQVVEASNSGEFSYGPSVLEGNAYQADAYGAHTPTSAKITTTAPPVVVTVLPFPPEGKPSSFNGAIGKFQIESNLKSSADVNVGDEMTLEINITFSGNTQNIPIPEIGRQPGFDGFFRLNDLPPQEVVEGNKKKITVQLRPLSPEIHEIPAIEFSSFDPVSSGYFVVHSQPIPITIKEVKGKVQPIKNEEIKVQEPQKIKPQEPIEQPIPKTQMDLSAPQPIEIEGIYNLTKVDLYNDVGGSWWVIALIPFGLALLVYQYQIHNYLEKRRSETVVLSGRNLLNQALQEPAGSSLYFDGLNHSLKVALVEVGLLDSAELANDDLPKNGLAGEVRTFLCDIEEKRFAGREFAGRDVLDYASVNIMALNLADKIQKSGIGKSKIGGAA